MRSSKITRNGFLKLAALSTATTLAIAKGKFWGTQPVFAEFSSITDPEFTTNTLFSNASQPFNWYVNSISGDDSNTGKSAKQAFQSIRRLLGEINEGDVIGLANGSHWREQLLVSRQKVQIRSYGAGEKPLLDCSELIQNSAFSKVAGYKNLYQVDVAIDNLAGSSSFVSVWEDDDRFVRATSLDECDNLSGTYIPSSDSGEIRLFIHPTSDTNPLTNNKKYEYSKRHTGINTYDAAGCTIIGIHCRRNVAQDGSIRAGRFNRVMYCLASEGNFHNILVRTGSYCYKVEAIDAYHTQGQALFVYNENSPNNETVTFNRCLAHNTSYNNLSVGFYGHQNISGSFGNVYFLECTARNVLVGFSGEHANIFEVDCQTTGTIGESRRILTQQYSISGSVDRPSSMVRAITILGGANTINIDNWSAHGTSPYVGLIWGETKNLKIRITNSTLQTNNEGQSILIWLTGPGCELYSHDNAFSVPPNNYYYNLPIDVELDSDDNRFTKPEQSMVMGGVVYRLSDYKIIFKQDLKSR